MNGLTLHDTSDTLNKWVVLGLHKCDTNHFNLLNIKQVGLTQI